MYTLLRLDPRSCLRVSLFSSLLYREKYQVPRYLECKHGRHSATRYPGISDDICSFFMSLWHPFREISYSHRAQSSWQSPFTLRSRHRVRRREIINIRSYMGASAHAAARKIAPRHVDTLTAMVGELSSKLLFLPANIKEKWLMHSISRRERNGDIFLQRYAISKGPSFTFHAKIQKCTI